MQSGQIEYSNVWALGIAGNQFPFVLFPVVLATCGWTPMSAGVSWNNVVGPTLTMNLIPSAQAFE